MKHTYTKKYKQTLKRKTLSKKTKTKTKKQNTYKRKKTNHYNVGGNPSKLLEFRDEVKEIKDIIDNFRNSIHIFPR